MCDVLTNSPHGYMVLLHFKLVQSWHWMWNKSLAFYHPAFELVTFNSIFHTLALPLFVTLFVTLSILCLYTSTSTIFFIMLCLVLQAGLPQTVSCLKAKKIFLCHPLNSGLYPSPIENFSTWCKSAPRVSLPPSHFSLYWEIVTINTIIIFSQPPDVKVTHIWGREGNTSSSKIPYPILNPGSISCS